MLALERAKLRQSHFSASGISPSKENTPRGPQQGLGLTTPLKNIKNYYSHLQKFVGDTDSGYFGNNKEPNRADEALTSGSFLHESNIQAANEVNGKFTNVYASDKDIPRNHCHSSHSTSRGSQSIDHFFTPSLETAEKMNIDDIPRLSLDSMGSMNQDREAYEERTRVSKDVKEVCNSSIREFASEESQNPQGRPSVGGVGDSVPFRESFR